MPSSNLPPEEQPKVKPFDPLVLDRTVIAVPLLREMKEDLDLIAKVQKAYPKAVQEFNSVIEFNKNFRGGAKAAREKVLTMAEDARLRTLSKPSTKPSRESRSKARPADCCGRNARNRKEAGRCAPRGNREANHRAASAKERLQFRPLARRNYPAPSRRE